MACVQQASVLARHRLMGP